MNTYIAVATTQPTPNSGANNNEVPINLGTGAVGTGLVLLSVLLTKLSALIDWKDVGKQWSGSQTSKVLQAENRKGQELEAEIDINQGLSDTVSRLASRGMDTTTEITKDLLHLVSDAIQTSSANAQSLQSLARANESVNKAHEDLINATRHNTEAVQALEQAIATIPTETASVIEVYAAEFRSSFDLLDDRLDRIEKNQRLYNTQIKDEFSAAFLELRRALKVKETG